MRRFVLGLFLSLAAFAPGQDYYPVDYSAQLSAILDQLSQNNPNMELTLIRNNVEQIDTNSLLIWLQQIYQYLQYLSTAHTQNNIYSKLQSLASDLSVVVSAVNGSYSHLGSIYDKLNGWSFDDFPDLSDDVSDIDDYIKASMTDKAQLALESTLQSILEEIKSMSKDLQDLNNTVSNGEGGGVQVDWEGAPDSGDGDSGGGGGSGGGDDSGGGDSDSFECNYDKDDFKKLFDWLDNNLGLTSKLRNAMEQSDNGEYEFTVVQPDASSIYRNSSKDKSLGFVTSTVGYSGDNFFETSISLGDSQLQMLCRLQDSLSQLIALVGSSSDSDKDAYQSIKDSINADSLSGSLSIDSIVSPVKQKWKPISTSFLPTSLPVTIPSRVVLPRIEYSIGNHHFDLGEMEADESFYGPFVENVRSCSVAILYVFVGVCWFYVFVLLWKLVHKYLNGFSKIIGFYGG